MARGPVDALRSLNRYVALTLGPDWETRLSSEKGVFARPFARVVQVPSLSIRTLQLSQMQYVGSYSVVVYPLPGVEADASQLEALRVVELLTVAFVGSGTPVWQRTPVDSFRGRPLRVPLYDYAGVPLDPPGNTVDESARKEWDFMRVEPSPEIQTFQDPADELLWSVVVNIRMSWLHSAAVTSGQPTTRNVRAGAQPDGGRDEG